MEYEKPTLKIIVVNQEDVVTTSGGGHDWEVM